jgi:hypothetical protein
MAKRVYTVISTSGWEGDGWKWRGEFDTRAEAEAREKEIVRHDAKSDGYITGIIGKTTICEYHQACYIGDTSRLNVPRHLRNRRAHISDVPNLEP